MNHSDDKFKNNTPEESRGSTSFEKKSVTIPRIEEEMHVGKKIVESGKVHIRKLVKEHQELVDIPLLKEEVKVERLQKNEFVLTAPPPVRQEGDTTIISVLEEVTIVEKRLLLVEEVHITKNQVHENLSHEVTLKKEEINIERSNDSDSPLQ